MSGKGIYLSSVLMTLLSLGVMRGQDDTPSGTTAPTTPAYLGVPQGPLDNPSYPGARPGCSPLPAFSTGPLNPSAPGLPRPDDYIPNSQNTGSVGPSEWIVYPRPPGSAGPMGANGLIGWELYLRNGVSIPVGGNYFGRVLDAGWDIEGGGRSLFYNPAGDAAWAVELGLGNIHNNVTTLKPVTLTNVQNLFATSAADQVFPSVVVTVKGLNRTYASVGLGREWFIWGSADPDFHETVWRMGADFGPRYGTQKLDLNELRHHTDTFETAFLAVHSDLELPYGPGFWVFGVRAEWSYTWNDILQHQNNSDIQDINLMLSIGYRY
jgi:hypothetical protein